jgi:hypothetical protein
LLAATLAVAVLLPLGSTTFGLYDRVEHWGKLVHAVDAACATLIFGLLLLGWRERNAVDLSDELCALLTMFAGVLFGLAWELVEFIVDWVAYADLQKSNTDTMTDFLCNDVAVVLAALLALRLYCHATGPVDRQRLGGVAEWLVAGPSRLLDRHGFALLLLSAGVILAAIAVLWFAGRPMPGLPTPPL